jgi:CRP/FNR family transcriptional regulator
MDPAKAEAGAAIPQGSFREPVAEKMARGGLALRRIALANQRAVPPHGHAGAGDGHHDGLQFLLKGWAARSTLLPDGRRQIVNIYLPGDFVGVGALFGKAPAGEIEALSELIYGSIPASELPALFCDNDCAAFLLAVMAREQRRVERHLVMLGRMTAEEKIAAAILGLYNRLRRSEIVRGHSFNCPLTQQQLADYLGLTVVHVNRVLRRLREDGILVVKKQLVMIIAPGRLRALADGNGARIGGADHRDGQAVTESPARVLELE